MVYDWDDKQEACYRMYVAERKSLDHVMKFFKDEVGFVPSKRAFQAQFRRWGFPSKQNPAHRNEILVDRTRELWEKNTTQKDMICILQSEGFLVTDRELMRLRSKHRLLLRGPNRTRRGSAKIDVGTSDPEPVQEPESSHEDHDNAAQQELSKARQSSDQVEQMNESAKSNSESVRAKRRRRRGLSDDPSGPPRFPSETTLESTKMCLGLDHASYLEVRSAFQAICQSQNIVKKTIVGPERWQAAKDQLMQRSQPLQRAFQTADQTLLEPMRLSLDVICMDVTKRLRIISHQMTLAEAKNLLNINPEQGRHLRQSLIGILTANNFVDKNESDNWEQLKQQWIVETGIGDQIPPPGHENHDTTLRAVQIVCRDIMKRWREAQLAKRGGKLIKPALSHPTKALKKTHSLAQVEPTVLQYEPAQSSQVQLYGTSAMQNQDGRDSNFDFQIDPELLMTAAKGAGDGGYTTLSHDGSYPPALPFQ